MKGDEVDGFGRIWYGCVAMKGDGVNDFYTPAKYGCVATKGDVVIDAPALVNWNGCVALSGHEAYDAELWLRLVWVCGFIRAWG